MRHRASAAGIFAILLAVYSLVAAQQTVTSASLSGRIEDATAAVVNGANLVATNLATGQKWTTSTDSEGRYRFPYLQVGDYSLSVQATGFSSLTKDLTLAVGQSIDLPLRMEVESVQAQVNINAEAIPLVETVRTQVTETIRPAEINQLPLNGRNYLDLALLVPGVSPTNTGSNQRFAETSAVPGQGLSIAGQRNLFNSFIVDGLSANDDAADLSGSYYSQEVVDQFQVITSGGIAEFGRTAAGVVNIVTKSGTNSLRGDLYGYFRNQRFDARNALAPSKDLLTQGQYGGTLSGPLAHARTFFFTNFEQTRRNYSAVVTISPTAVATINNRLNAVNFRGPRIETGVVPASFDTTNFFGRLDHRFNDRNQLSARYSLYHITASNSRTVGGLNSISRGSGLDDTDQTLAVSNITTINNHSINEARVQYTRSQLDAPINDVVGPSVAISGVANFGSSTTSPLARDINLFEVVNNVSTQIGAHSPKVGVSFLYNRVNILFPGALQGVYNFTSLANFVSGNYTTFQQAFGAQSQSQSNPNFGVFVQDEWRVSPALTINAGLRYDAQFLPDPIQTDTNNFAPRIGVAFAPGDRKTVIRASAGIYFDRVPLRATSNALQRDGSKYVVIQFSPTQAGAPVFPNTLAAQPSVFLTKPNITRIDSEIDSSYSSQANLQIERELTANTLVSAGYIHQRTTHIILSRNINVPTVPASAGIPNLGRPDPNWGNIGFFEGSGNSNYDGLVVSLNRRMASWTSVRASYTLSKTIDNAGNFFFSTPQNNFNLREEKGLSDNDQRHRLVLSGSIESPRKMKEGWRRALNGFQLSYIFTYASALPFNVLLGSDRNFDTNTNDRPVGVGRNTGRGFNYATLDLRVRRRIVLTERTSLDLVAEGFNVLNRANYGVPNNTFGAGVQPLASFGRPTLAFDSRQFQFGMKLQF
jgi:hypothetical protein